MNTFITAEILLSLTAGLCILVFIRTFYLSRAVTIKDSMLKSTTQSLEIMSKELNELRQIKERFSDFKDDLNKAEISTQVHKSRISYNKDNEKRNAPERYNYIHSLKDKGITPPDIASILTISTHEADQLVKLAKLSAN